MEDNDHGAGLIHQVASPLAETEPHPTCQQVLGMGGKVYRCCLDEGHQGNIHAHNTAVMWSTPQIACAQPSLSRKAREILGLETVIPEDEDHWTDRPKRNSQ